MGYLKDRRLALGITQKEVAQAIGVSEACVSKWERGEIANMKRNYIADYAKVLKTSPTFIMTGQGLPVEKVIDDEIATMIKKLNDTDTEALRAILRAMTNK